MTMTIVQVCIAKYPGQVETMNISFKTDSEGDLIIDSWTVPGIERPTEAELLAEAPQYELPYQLLMFKNTGVLLLQNLIDTTAQAKQYNNGVYCASYVNSTVQQWHDEATAFVEWRDSVYSYAIAQQALMESGQRSIPTFEEFKAELPVMVWPD